MSSAIADAVIVGGGPAGAMAALQLAAAGRAVTIIEREALPQDKVCGEFLSTDTTALLAETGIDPVAMGASRIECLRLIHPHGQAEHGLPFIAHGLSRRTLDAALLDKAEAAGATVLRGRTATSAFAGNTHRLDVRGANPIEGHALFLATGKHDLRGLERPAPRGRSALIGLKQHFRLDARQRDALNGWIELYLFPGGYAGLQLIEDGIANLCLLVTQRAYRTLGSDWDMFLPYLCNHASALGRRLNGAVPLLARVMAIAKLPFGYIHQPSEKDSSSLFRLGDQAAVIPSFSGDGMAIALHSGKLAAQMLLSGKNAQTYHAQLADDVAQQFRYANVVQRLALHPLGQYALVAGAWLGPAAMSLIAERTRMRG